MMLRLETDFALGTVQLGIPYGRNKGGSLCSIAEAENIFETAWQFGVRAFDTASGYGCAMERLANWLQATDRMNQAKVVNKVSPLDCLSKGALDKACNPFRNAAQLDLLVHGFVGEADWTEFQNRAGERGANPGLSVYTADELLHANALGASLVQAPANALDFRQLNAAKVAQQRTDFRSVFLQGLLLDSPEMAESRFPGSGIFPEAVESASKALGISPQAALIGAVLNAKKPLDRLVIGVDTPNEMAVWKEALAVSPNQSNRFITAVANELKTAPSDSLLDPRTWPTK